MAMQTHFTHLVFAVAAMAPKVPTLLWLWPLFGAVCIARFVIVSRRIRKGRGHLLRGNLRLVWHILLLCALIAFALVEGTILSAALVTPKPDLPYIIVLGAKVNGTVPSGALRIAGMRLTDGEKLLALAAMCGFGGGLTWAGVMMTI